jgi:hypothetical protein
MQDFGKKEAYGTSEASISKTVKKSLLLAYGYGIKLDFGSSAYLKKRRQFIWQMPYDRPQHHFMKRQQRSYGTDASAIRSIRPYGNCQS